MIEILNNLKTYDENKKPSKIKKILCILEGKTEYQYISKIFSLFGYDKGCYSLSDEYVKVAWGNKLPPAYNIVDSNCNFPGGSCIKDSPVPLPAIKAYEMFKDDNEISSIYDSLIIMFDSDKDKENFVKNYFKEELKSVNIKNLLFISIPCFESTMIDFCKCGNCRNEINKTDELDQPCSKYKKKFSSLKCFSSYTNTNCTNQKLSVKGLINFIDNNDISSLKSNLSNVNKIIEKFYQTIN